LAINLESQRSQIADSQKYCLSYWIR